MPGARAARGRTWASVLMGMLWGGEKTKSLHAQVQFAASPLACQPPARRMRPELHEPLERSARKGKRLAKETPLLAPGAAARAHPSEHHATPRKVTCHD